MKLPVVRFYLFALVLFFMAQAAHAQITLKADIPFKFVAGGLEFPAGSCSFARPERSGGALTIMVRCGSVSSAMGALPITQRGLTFAPPKNEISFRRYGDRYFLSEVWIKSRGGEINPSPQEKHAAADGTEAVLVHLKVKGS